MIRKAVALITAAAAVSFAASTVFGEAPSSPCKDAEAYFSGAYSHDDDAKVEQLGNIVAELDEASQDVNIPACNDVLVERVLYENASELERYSTTFPGDAEATLTWTSKAVTAYQAYIDWFINLGEARQDAIIRAVTKRLSDAPFKTVRRNWIRMRVGNAVHSLGACLVRRKAFEDLLTKYESLCQQTAEIFPNEATSNWYKWLTSLDDFQREKTWPEIHAAIETSPNDSNHWSAFDACLSSYIVLNPSASGQWLPVEKRVDAWLR